MSTWPEVLKKLAPGLDPRHVEAYLRLQYGTLGELSQARIKFEVENGGPDGSIRDAILEDPEGAEELAQTYNLYKETA